MITKERLQELIEQGAIIHTTKYSYRDCGIKLDNNHFDATDKSLVFTYKAYEIALDELFETKEDADWFAKFKRIAKTDYLDLPTWEEIKYQKDWFVLKFHIRNNFDGFGKIIILKNHSIHVQSVSLGVMHQEYFDEPATKENYAQACEIARKLFIGEIE